jgi:hypothetical protein
VKWNAWGLAVLDVIESLHDVYGWIKAADPTAKITSPSVLNFDFTCMCCGSGIPTGRSWAEEYRTEYLVRYGEEPPVDIWAIDIFRSIGPAYRRGGLTF